jgi:hypothetical protein
MNGLAAAAIITVLWTPMPRFAVVNGTDAAVGVHLDVSRDAAWQDKVVVLRPEERRWFLPSQLFPEGRLRGRLGSCDYWYELPKEPPKSRIEEAYIFGVGVRMGSDATPYLVLMVAPPATRVLDRESLEAFPVQPVSSSCRPAT